MIVGAGTGPCTVLALGAQGNQTPGGWGGYTVDETAARHGVSVGRETSDAGEAYARFGDPFPTRYGGWLPTDTERT